MIKFTLGKWFEIDMDTIEFGGMLVVITALLVGMFVAVVTVVGKLS